MVGAYRVQMTQMPQLVALFNGVGGGAAAIVALLELHTMSEVFLGAGRSSRRFFRGGSHRRLHDRWSAR